MMTIDNLTTNIQEQDRSILPAPPQEWIFESEADKEGTDSVSVTIGTTNYGSGSAIVATTTQEADEIRTVPLWPSVTTTTRVDSAIVAIDNHHRQRHGGHRNDTNNKPTVSFPSMGQGGRKAIYRNPRSGSQSVQADSHSKRPLHQYNLVGRSEEPHLQATSYY
jgi:hypothetical protein